MAGNHNSGRQTGDGRWAEAVMRAAMEIDGRRKDAPPKLHRLAKKLVDLALDGDMTALKEVGDRLDGKPKQALEVDSDNTTRIIADKPMTVEDWAKQYGAEMTPKSNGKAH